MMSVEIRKTRERPEVWFLADGVYDPPSAPLESHHHD
jgi:hypothetical protein